MRLLEIVVWLLRAGRKRRGRRRMRSRRRENKTPFAVDYMNNITLL